MSKLYWSNKKTCTMAVNIPKSLYMAMGWKPGDLIILDILGEDKIKITRREIKFNPELWDTRKLISDYKVKQAPDKKKEAK